MDDGGSGRKEEVIHTTYLILELGCKVCDQGVLRWGNPECGGRGVAKCFSTHTAIGFYHFYFLSKFLVDLEETNNNHGSDFFFSFFSLS